MTEAGIIADPRNPDRLMLLASFGDGSPIFFVLEGKNTVRVYVQQIQREDGSGYNFNVTGSDVQTHEPVRIYYNTNRREGHITFLSANLTPLGRRPVSAV